MNCKKIWAYILLEDISKLPESYQNKLLAHNKHELELVRYYGKTEKCAYAIECQTCCEVLFDDETLSKKGDLI